MHTDHCSEFELRDAMHALYPHRHEASIKHHKSMFGRSRVFSRIFWAEITSY